ncbi:methyltransferase domain-containing protein [Bacteroidota bacterium]
MKAKDWNPELYLKFGKERIQPSIDLVSRIDFKNPKNIIDIGCGPGNSTQILAERWPDARILGVDKSPAMIEKAKRDYPNQDWRIMDSGKNEINEKFDIVFSNATIQWISNHADLLKRFYNLLIDGGMIAIQLPLFFDMPLGKSIASIAEDKRWSSFTKEVTSLFTIHDCSTYYNYLTEFYNSMEIWESDYIHILDSQESILEMIRSTGLRPYLDKLDNEKDRNNFEDLVLKGIIKDYPLQKDGKVLFPFKRLFFIAKR